MLLKLENIKKEYKISKSNKQIILNDINLELSSFLKYAAYLKMFKTIINKIVTITILLNKLFFLILNFVFFLLFLLIYLSLSQILKNLSQFVFYIYIIKLSFIKY